MDTTVFTPEILNLYPMNTITTSPTEIVAEENLLKRQKLHQQPQESYIYAIFIKASNTDSITLFLLYGLSNRKKQPAGTIKISLWL